MSEKVECQLGIDIRKAEKCRPGECASCRWNPKEAARREELLRTEGFTLCEDGTRRLIIHGKRCDG